MIDTIIFDWAGVVSDNIRQVYAVSMMIFKTHGVPLLTLEQYLHEFEAPYMNFYWKFIPGCSKAEQDKQFAEEIVKQPPSVAFPGIVDEIHRLHAAGKRLYVLSADGEATIFAETERFGVRHLFSEIAYGIHDKMKEIAPMVKRHGINPETSCIIGDTVHEIDTGRSVGMKTAAVTWGFTDEKRLSAAKPDYLFHTVSDLHQLL